MWSVAADGYAEARVKGGPDEYGADGVPAATGSDKKSMPGWCENRGNCRHLVPLMGSMAACAGPQHPARPGIDGRKQPRALRHGHYRGQCAVVRNRRRRRSREPTISEQRKPLQLANCRPKHCDCLLRRRVAGQRSGTATSSSVASHPRIGS